MEKSLDLFPIDAPLVYGLLGRCSLVSIETRKLNGEEIPFYKIVLQKMSPIKTTRPNEAIILVPVESARQRGLRPVISKDQVEDVLAIVGSREFYFSTDERWDLLQKTLEKAINEEGIIGLAKALSCLYVIKKRSVVASSEISKFYESVERVLLRELAEVLEEPIKSVEEKVHKLLLHKLLPDH